MITSAWLLAQSPTDVVREAQKGDLAAVIALLVFALFAAVGGVMRGWWIPGTWHRAALDEKDRQIAAAEKRAAEWRLMWERSAGYVETQHGTLEEIVGAARILEKIQQRVSDPRGRS